MGRIENAAKASLAAKAARDAKRTGLEQKRSYSDVMKAMRAKAETELGRAKAGNLDFIGAMACALACNAGYHTVLTDWPKMNPPHGPSRYRDDKQDNFVVGEKVLFKWTEVVEWNDVTRNMTRAQKKVWIKERDKRNVERQKGAVLKAQHELLLQVLKNKQLEEEMLRLQKKIDAYGFATLADTLVPTDWVSHKGLIVGHVLTVTDAQLTRAINDDDVVEMPLTDALVLPWDKPSHRQPFVTAYIRTSVAMDSQIEEAGWLDARKEIDSKVGGKGRDHKNRSGGL